MLRELLKIENREKVIKAEEILSFFLTNNIKISLDDFGTLLSNFDKLIGYKDVIKSIKIDKVLWINILNVAKEIVSFCSENGIDVIFEKVETKQEIDRLIGIGGRLFQGWYFRTTSWR